MKNFIIVGVLLTSILLNAAGIVFFILFLSERAHYKSLRREKASVERSLSIISSGNRIAEAINSDQIEKCTFVSHTDGQLDNYAFQPPQYLSGALDYTLVVYLHGMGSTQLEPFVAHPGQNQPVASVLSQANPRLAILSCNYRKDSWGSDSAVADVVQNIREVLQKYPFKNIVFMGTSMGGCVALNLASIAPDDIKSKLLGVVSMESTGDLKALWDCTKDEQIRPAMMVAFGGTPDQVLETYKRKSFLQNIGSLPRGARIYVVSARADRVVPPELQKALVDALNQRAIANHMDEIDGNHQAPDSDFYARGLRFVLGQTN